MNLSTEIPMGLFTKIFAGFWTTIGVLFFIAIVVLG